jgi:hypothetical protein
MPSRIPELFKGPLSDALKLRFKNTWYPNRLTDRSWEIGLITDAMRKDVSWALAEADKLSDARNDVIHSPLVSLSNVVDPSDIKIRVASRMNPRAKKLGKKDILPEMRRCRDTAIVLRYYCLQMERSLSFGATEWPWPEKPRLPSRAGKSPPVSRRPKTRTK